MIAYLIIGSRVLTNLTMSFNFSEHTNNIKDIIHNMAKHISASDIIPQYVIELISRPTSQNGIHILNPVKSAISASCAPLMRSIQIAKHGIPLKKNKYDYLNQSNEYI